MNVLQKQVVYDVAGGTLVAQVDTLVTQTPPVEFPFFNSRVIIHAYARFFPADDQTSLGLTIRRGATLADPVVAVTTITFPLVGQNVPVSFDASEYLQNMDGAIYSLSASQAGGVGNGNWTEAFLSVEVLNG
jgi:hypothetical protein